MALRTCPECSNQVSDAAQICPHCGYPFTPGEAQTNTSSSPGWYKDPSGEAVHEAYWDGEKWTGETRRPGAPDVPRSTSVRSRPWLLAGGALLVVGSFLPWAQAGIFSFAGTRGDGAITLVLGIIVGILGFVTPTKLGAVAAIVLSALGLLIVSNVVNNFLDTPENIGAGIFVAGLGGLVGVMGGVKALEEARSS